MDLVARQLCACKGFCGHTGCGLGQVLFGAEHRRGGQQAKAPQGAGGAALLPCRVAELFAQHLIAAAHAQHRRTGCRKPEHRRFQSAFPQPAQVVHGVLGAGQDDEIRCTQLAGALHIPHAQQRVLFQRDKVGEVGHMRQAQDGDIQRLDRSFCIQPVGEGVLVLDLHPQVRHYAQHGQLRFFFQHGKAGPQDLHIAPELVDDQAPDAGTLVGFQQFHSAVQLGEYAAAVDIARQQHRRIHQLCKAHVHDIVGFQVDLCRAARAFDHDNVVLGGKAVVGFQNVRDKAALHPEIIGGGHLAPGLAVHDHLTAHIAAGLEQDGVHPHIRLHACSLCLHHLSTAHLCTVAGDEAVQGHVLAFERGHAVAILRKDAAQRRAQQAFARTAHGALHHNAFCLAHCATSGRVSASSASSCRFSFSVRTAVRYQLASRPG